MLRCRFTLGVVSLVLVLPRPACRSAQQVHDEQQNALTSLSETVAAIGEAWVSGSVSGRYARTALDATLLLLTARHDELDSSPELLADSSVAAISQAQEELSHRIALMWRAVDQGDAAAARTQIERVHQTDRRAP